MPELITKVDDLADPFSAVRTTPLVKLKLVALIHAETGATIGTPDRLTLCKELMHCSCTVEAALHKVTYDHLFGHADSPTVSVSPTAAVGSKITVEALPESLESLLQQSRGIVDGALFGKSECR